MDPQQRLALELGWEAIEDAGIASTALLGEPVGVFMGAIGGDYSRIADRLGVDAIDRYTVTGLHRGLIANRISYTLGLTGPSMTVDAAQASSLVAVHLACESLRRGEARLALAGGVHLNIDPQGALEAARFGGLSPDGRCFTFDARANGYVRGEGGGIVALKPLRAAREDGDRVYCTIRGSAVNSDGPSSGLTVPNADAQAEVLRRACRRAGVKQGDVEYVELHGSGTPVGDPVEAAALGAVLGKDREGAGPLRVGSVKTNIGHLEGAAGIAGLIKTALAIERGQLPPSLNFERPNPEIALDELGLRVQESLEDWPAQGDFPVAGVSSFGMGGTNCHVVLTGDTGPVAVAGRPSAAAPSRPLLLPLSAKSGEALAAQASRLAERLREAPDLAPADLAYSLATTRAPFSTRAVAVGDDRAELLGALEALAQGRDDANLVRGTGRTVQAPAFLFPGQGSQWVGMGLELYRSSKLFQDQIDACEQALSPFVDWSLAEVLADTEGSWLDRLDIVQPALFGVMVSLARLWQAHGVAPAAVLGHSQGEIAAAHVAGGLSLEDAARIVARRAQAMAKIAGRGSMLSVSLTEAELAPRLEAYEGRLAIAAVNGPASLIVSGELDALAELLRECERDEIRAQTVAVDYAAHSAQVEALEDELLEAFAPVSPRSGEIPFYSTVTGEALDTARLDARYWYRNLRETVRFEAATRALLDSGQRLLLEIGPHPVLGFPLGETVEEVLDGAGHAGLLYTLRREEGDTRRFMLSLAAAHAQGAELDWEALFAGTGAKRVPLPTYPFQRRRHWLDTREGAASGGRLRPAAPGHGSAEAQPELSAAPTGGLGDRLAELPGAGTAHGRSRSRSRRGRGGPRLRVRRRDRFRAGVQGDGLRLARRGGVAQPPAGPHRALPTENRRLRLPEPRCALGPPAWPGQRGRRRG